MDDKKKVTLSLTPEALAVLDRYAGGERKRGEFVSALLTEYGRAQEASESNLAARLEQLEDQLRQMSERLAQLEDKNK